MLPRRSTCSSSGSATRADATSVIGTTSASWSSTSSRVATAAAFKGKFSGHLADVRVDGSRLALLKPDTYMNDSGRSVQPAVAFYKAPLESLLVVHDEVDLDLGRLQARLGGGLAGHNGLRSIAGRLGSPEFLRLRVGVGRPGRGDPRDIADFVLAPFAPEDDAESIVARAADAVESLASVGLDEAQRLFN